MFDAAPNEDRKGKLLQGRLILNEDGLLADAGQMLQLIHDLSKQTSELLSIPALRMFISEADFTNLENLTAIIHAISCPATAEKMRRMGIDLQDFIDNAELVGGPVEAEQQEEGIQWPQPPSNPSRTLWN